MSAKARSQNKVAQWCFSSVGYDSLSRQAFNSQAAQLVTRSPSPIDGCSARVTGVPQQTRSSSRHVEWRRFFFVCAIVAAISTSFPGRLPGKRLWATLPAARCAWPLRCVLRWSAVRLITSLCIVALSLSLKYGFKKLGNNVCRSRMYLQPDKNKVFNKT